LERFAHDDICDTYFYKLLPFHQNWLRVNACSVADLNLLAPERNALGLAVARAAQPGSFSCLQCSLPIFWFSYRLVCLWRIPLDGLGETLGKRSLVLH